MAKKGEKKETNDINVNEMDAVISAENALDSSEIIENAIEERDETDEAFDDASSNPKKGRKAKNIEIKDAKPSKKSKSNNKIRGKLYQSAKKSLKSKEMFALTEAVKLLKEVQARKFNESIEAHINLGTDPKNSDQRIRFTTSLPYGIGKSVKILVITDNDKTSSQLESDKKDNILVKDKTVVDEITSNKLIPGKDFDIVITNPSVMKDLGRIAKVLGPKGMMPSLKNNTITDNISKAIEEFAKGQVEIKSQPGHAVIHQIVGTKAFAENQLVENVQTLIDEISKHSPSKLKKKLIQSVYLSSSMSPSIKINV